MADAQSVSTQLNGKDPATGKWLGYRLVNFLREAQIGDLSTTTDGTSEGPNSSGSIFDQIVTLSKILTRRYKGMDIWDMVATLYQAHLDEQTKK